MSSPYATSLLEKAITELRGGLVSGAFSAQELAAEVIAAQVSHADRCHQDGAFWVVEQNLGFLMQVMHQVKVLDHGEMVLSGRDLRRDQMERHLKV